MAIRKKCSSASIAVAVVTLTISSIGVQGASSAPKRTKTKLSASAFPAAVDPGASTILSGKVSSKRRACFKRAKVTLRAGKTKLATRKTTKRGAFSFTVPVDAPTTFRVSTSSTRRCKGSSRTLEVGTIAPPPPLLEGDPDGPAEDAIPDASFPAPHPDDLEFSEEVGMVMSTTEFMIVPRDDATVEEINDLISALGATVIGGNAEMGWILVRLAGEPTSDEVLAAIDLAEDDPAVDLAAPEVVLQENRVPGTDPNPSNPPGPQTTPDWTWGLPPSGGNWHLEATRVPQAWNLLDELARSQTIPGLVADIDSGFDVAHPDLVGKVTLETLGGRNANPAGKAQDHGTATAGIIAARFHNYRFLDGVSPVLELEDGTNLGGVVALPHQRPTTMTPAEVSACTARPGVDASFCRSATFALRLMDDFTRMHAAHPEIRIYTNSMGYAFNRCAPHASVKWRAAGVSGTPEQQAAARRLIRRMGRAFERTFPDLNAFERNVVWFGSAGNDSDVDGTLYPLPIGACQGFSDADGDGLVDIDLDGDGTPDDPGPVDIPASVNSPACTAALDLAVAGIFCVEATTNAPGYPRANFSNSGGNLSAPGDDIATLTSTTSGSVRYPTSGTSYSAPLAAGIANFVDILGNRGAFRDRPEQDLTARGLYDLILGTASPGQGRAPMIDMFSAAVGLDLANGNHLVQRALIDVDDGSEFDGNARRDNDDADDDGNTSEPFRSGIVTDDGLRGDGRIDMRDFRAFRDALLTSAGLVGDLALTDIFLDGPASGFKHDLNFDACADTSVANFFDAPPPLPPATDCSSAPAEVIYPRFDFNGDGVVNGLSTQPAAQDLAPFLGDPSTPCLGLNNPPGCVRDIDVLAEPDLWDEFAIENVLPGSSSGEDCTSPQIGWKPTSDLLQDLAGPTSATPDGTLDYLLSADVHLDVGADPTGDMDHVYIDVDSEMPPNGVDDDGDGKTDEPFEESFHRCFDIGPQGGRALVTMPLYTGHVLVTVIGEDLDIDGEGKLTEDPYGFRSPETGSGAKVLYGEDLVLKVEPSA